MSANNSTTTKLKLGGGVVIPLKQFLPTQLIKNSNSFEYNGLNITLSADSYFQDNLTSSNISGSINGACNEFEHLWSAPHGNLPHFYQVDFGKIIYIKKVCFNPATYIKNCLVKNYNIQYSIDGITFKNIYDTSLVYIPGKETIGVIKQNPIDEYYEDCINQFNMIKARIIRINIYSNYNYPRPENWAGLCNLRIFGVTDFYVLFLKESDNCIYNNLSKKLISFTDWKKLDKQEKLNLIKTSYINDNNEEEIKITELKSFGSFKIIAISE